MEREKILEFIKKYNLMPEKVYAYKQGKVEVSYLLFNSSYDSEIIMEHAKEELGSEWSYNKLAYEAFCIMDIQYSQENEFFID